MNVPPLAITALVSCVVACHCGAQNDETPAADPEVFAATPPPSPPPANPTYDGYDGPLAASSSAGVFLLDSQGAIQAKISDKPGHSPRWLRPGETLLVLRSNEASEGERTLTLVEVDVTAGTERLLVDDLIGDTIECPTGSVSEYGEELEEYREELDVQDDWHFRVSAERGLACAWLMDSNFNTHTLAVEAKVNLADGSVVHEQLRASHCTPAPNEADDDPDCLAMSLTVNDHQASHAELTSIGPYHVRDGALWRRDKDTDELIAGPFGERVDPETEEPSGLAAFDPVSLSPSGRWAVLWGNDHWGDYLHMSWLLLDTQTGELFAISGPTWPAPLSREALGRLDYATVDNDVTPETNRVWLSDDRLVIGRWLIVPGEAVVELPGELAR